jgi:predicted component of type VI protein secretion system
LRPAATAAASASGAGGRGGGAFAGAASVVVDAYTANTPTPYSVVTAAATPMATGSSTRFASSIAADARAARQCAQRMTWQHPHRSASSALFSLAAPGARPCRARGAPASPRPAPPCARRGAAPHG